MAQREKFGFRNQAYSVWHRANSIGRFVGRKQAEMLSMIDVDATLWCEFDDCGRRPLVLVEVAEYRGALGKCCTVIEHLAERANLPAMRVLYELADEPNPSDERAKDIKAFWVTVLNMNSRRTKRLTPDEYSALLLRMRANGLLKYEGQ